MYVFFFFSLLKRVKGKVSPWNPEFRHCFRTLGLGQAGSANSPSITFTGIIITFQKSKAVTVVALIDTSYILWLWSPIGYVKTYS